MTIEDIVMNSSSEQSEEPEDTAELPPQPTTPTRSLQSQQHDNDSESDHDTLGLHWDDEPNEGGVLPNATSKVCVIFTRGTIVPFQSIKIPKIDESAPSSPALDPNGPHALGYNPSRPGNAHIVLGDANHRSGSGDVISRISDIDDMSFKSLNITNNAMTNQERIDVATENLKAGMTALDNAEFDTAAVSFLSGREMLGKNGWDVDFKTMLQLTSEAANAAYITGDFDNMNVLIDEVLNRKGISVEDKFRVYEVKILAEQGKICVDVYFVHILCTFLFYFILTSFTLSISNITTGAGNYHESIALGIDIRKQLGLKTPKDKKTSVLTILKGYMKTNWLLGNKSAEELSNLPELTNERIIMGQRILELMEISCYQVSTSRDMNGIIYSPIIFLVICTYYFCLL